MDNNHKGIFATLEEPQELSTGPWPGDDFLGCALPDRRALHQYINVYYKGKKVQLQVMDVGPWAVDDHEYVFGDQRPRAEKYKGQACPLRMDGTGHATLPGGAVPEKCNGAGIDLFPEAARRLGLTDNAIVDWEWA